MRSGLSARLDGEDPGVPEVELDRHVAGCPACAGWLEGAATITRRVRLRPVEEQVDLAPAVVAAVRTAELGLWARPWSRAALALTALAQLLLSLPALLLGQDAHAALHVAREVGVTDTALAIGVLCAAWRPWRAAGMLPVVGALAVGLTATTVVDVLTGHIPAAHELPHLLAWLEVVLLWRLRHGGVAQRPTDAPSSVLRRVA